MWDRCMFAIIGVLYRLAYSNYFQDLAAVQ